MEYTNDTDVAMRDQAMVLAAYLGSCYSIQGRGTSYLETKRFNLYSKHTQAPTGFINRANSNSSRCYPCWNVLDLYTINCGHLRNTHVAKMKAYCSSFLIR